MKNKHKNSKDISGKENKTKAIKISIFLLIIVAIVVLILTFIPKQTDSAPDPKSLRQVCASFCETNQRTLFCFAPLYKNEVKIATCDELSSDLKYSNYNVEKCSSITCEPGGNN